MMETVTVGPWGIFFTNKNREMNLPGHSHFAQVFLEFVNVPEGDRPTRGFPSFHDTSEEILTTLRTVVERPIEGTNEEVARLIFQAFVHWNPPTVAAWGGKWALLEVRLGVQGVRDRIGHAEAMTFYRVARVVSEAVALEESRPRGVGE